LNKFEAKFKDIDEYKSKDIGLERIDIALKSLQFNPSLLGKIVHIAGTNGKGSTAYFLSQIFNKIQLKTALFTSPHLLKINERIKINNTDISDLEFDNLFCRYEHVIDTYNLTYFETIFLLFILHATENSVDITILETGLGGRYDATNTSLINDKVIVITSISSDHTEVLGKNIFAITNEKLAIIRDDNRVFIGINNSVITKYIRDKININNSTFLSDQNHNNTNTNIIRDIDPIKNDYPLSPYPYPYNENYYLAKLVASTIYGQELIIDSLLLLPPARYEQYKNIIFDATHNIGGLLKLIKTIDKNEIGFIIFSLTANRNINRFLPILKLITDNILLTTIPNSPRSISVSELESIDCQSFISPIDAYNFALKHSNKKILILGSFYLIAFYKNYFEIA